MITSWSLPRPVLLLGVLSLIFLAGFAFAQEDPEVPVDPATQADEGEYEPIGNDDCSACHEEAVEGGAIMDTLSHSVHEGFDCLDCHVEKDTAPHRPPAEDFAVGCKGCRTCHEDAAEAYQAHGRSLVGECSDMPQCKDCHGGHDILPSSAKHSKTHPLNLPATCGHCHSDLNLTAKYDILIDKPIELYDEQRARPGQQGRHLRRRHLQRLPLHRRDGAQDPLPGPPGLGDQPLQHPDDLRQVPQRHRQRLLGGHPRQAGRPWRDRRSGLHPLPRRARHLSPTTIPARRSPAPRSPR